MKGIWITWEKQRRNKGISSALGWPLYEITCSKSRTLRYCLSSFKTILIIIREKPQIVAAQNPSIVLSSLVVVFKYLLNYKVIIDAHNSGVYPLEGHNTVLMMVSRWLQKHADMTIVTNDLLKSVVDSHGGKGFILPDKIPSSLEANEFFTDGRASIAFICTFSEDEPYKEVFEATRLIPQDVFIYVTGKYPGKVDPSSLASNVKLLGFIPENLFWSLLSSVDLIMDLTLREGCLVCGAYEGVSLGKPLILSDTQALRSYFNQGCVYVAPTATSIAAGIEEAMSRKDEMISKIKELKKVLEKNWESRFHDLEDRISRM